MRRVLALVACLQAPLAFGLNTATSVPVSTSAGVNLSVGWPGLGAGVRLPVLHERLSLLVGTSLRPALWVGLG